jgi:hypothetical protein
MEKSILNNVQSKELDKAYEKASDDYLRDALKRTHTERFLYATMLYKVQQTMKKATIVHKKIIDK